MGSYLPSTASERREMLAGIGLSSFDALYDDVPAPIRLSEGALQLPDGVSEMEASAHIRSLAEKKGLSVEEVSRASLSRIPMGRYGDPEEYGRLAVFLGSEANTYITGQTILADGGMTRAVP